MMPTTRQQRRAIQHEQPRRFRGHALQVWCTLEVRDTDTGELIDRMRFASRSYVIGFMAILATQLGQSGVFTAVDTGGSTRTLATNSNNMATNSGPGATLTGIVVGTGTTAVTASDSKLVTLIATGLGAGQLQYTACFVGGAGVSGSNSQFSISRGFANSSGSSITPTECGLYMTCNSTPFYFCALRDLIAAGVGIAIPPGKTLTVTYTLVAPS